MKEEDRKLIERLKAERTAKIERENAEHDRMTEGRTQAYADGQRIGGKWIYDASYEWIETVTNANSDTLLSTIEARFPEEVNKYRNFFRDEFLNGWRQGVKDVWESIKSEI